MLRIAALNESDSGEDELQEEDAPTTTKEAEEAEAFAIYNRSLGLQRSGDAAGAEELLSSLLCHPFLQQASHLVDSETEDNHHLGLPLLYLVHKHLASLAITRDKLEEGMKSYIEAVKIDSSEVTVWYKMGIIARKLHNYPLAKLAFEQGLQCSENHWPCLDNVITVLYALNDYWMCLDYIGRALECDCHYTKGLVFHRKILKEQPSLTSETKEMFAYCDPIIYSIQVDEKEAKEFIQEAVQIREIRRELAKKPPPPPLKLPKPITELTWKCVGECLVELFDTYAASDPPKSLVLSLDLSEYREMAGCSANESETKANTETPSTQPSSSGGAGPCTAEEMQTFASSTSGEVRPGTSNMTEASISLVEIRPGTEALVLLESGERSSEQPMEVDGGEEILLATLQSSAENLPASLTEQQQLAASPSQPSSVIAVKQELTLPSSAENLSESLTEQQQQLPASVLAVRQEPPAEAETVNSEAQSVDDMAEVKEGDAVIAAAKSEPPTILASSTDSSAVLPETRGIVVIRDGNSGLVSEGVVCLVSSASHIEGASASIIITSSATTTTATTSTVTPSKSDGAEAVSVTGALTAVTSIDLPVTSGVAVNQSNGHTSSAAQSTVTALAESGENVNSTVASADVGVVNLSLAPTMASAADSQPQLPGLLQLVTGQDKSSGVSPASTSAGSRHDDHTYTSDPSLAPLTTVIQGSSSDQTNTVGSSTSAESGILTILNPPSESQTNVPVTHSGEASVAPPPLSSSSDNTTQVTPDGQSKSPFKSIIQVSEAKPTPLLSALVASVPLQTLASSLPPIQIPLPANLRIGSLTSLSSTSSVVPTTAHSHPLPPKPPSAATPPPAHSSLSPFLPKFQFSTITARQVQALLQDPLPSTPLLSTPAPSTYSPKMADRLRQMTSLSPPMSSSPSTTATAQLQSLARLANLTNSLPSSGQEVVATGHTAAEQTLELGASPPLPSASGKSPLSHSTPVSAEVALQDHSGVGKGNKGAKRGTKRKRAPVEDNSFFGFGDYGVKRRSARVRNTRKEEENVDFQKLLRNFLPSTLMGTVQIEEDTQTQDTQTSTSQFDTTVTSMTTESPLQETETEDVGQYLAECLNGQSVIGMMYKYLVYLSSRDTRQWPSGVPHLYCEVYSRLHPHLTFPSLFCMDFPEVCYSEMAKMALMWCELSLDSYLVQKADNVMSPAMAQRFAEGGGTVRSPFITDSATSDMHFITGMVNTGLSDLLGDQVAQFTMRVYWLKARLAMADNRMDAAVENLETVAYCLEQGDGPRNLCLPNFTQGKLISLEEVKRQQESLQRFQSLEETQRLFDTGQYQQVVDYLTPTFTPSQAPQTGLKPTMPDPERHVQLELLQDALFRLEDWRQCLLWGEVALNEALHHYRRAPTIRARDDWALTLIHLFQSLQKVLDKDPNAVGSLPSQSAIRFVQNLMRVIEINHDVSDTVTEMPITSVLPWILLYRMIRHEEDKLNALKLPDAESQEEMEGAISSSLMLLRVGHEYLGRHAWCTRDCGVFLLFFMDVLAAELAKADDSVKDDLEKAFGQCVFCLYSHPNKKGKARHLDDHNATPIELIWDKCEVVFEYFKPKALPEFDSYKTSTVSAELENLLRRIYELVPESIGPGKRSDQVREYIEGDTNIAPNFSTDSPILQELYYLLADYYFKNKEPAKAIKFYIYDVCFNSWRLDSWAGLALAKTCQIEQKLNSMELRIETPLHRKGIAALRCFSRAVEIDDVRKLWIEYGALAYQLHSHASRQLRMQLWFPLTPELLEIAMETRVEMLATARNCYWKASKCEAEGSEEEWLHHYMMGKVMEKKQAHPRFYLEHYKQAAIYLHEEKAQYPSKIHYQHISPHLSLEALEMYYRLHVAVMKHLLRTQRPETRDDMALFDRYVTEAKDSPFALRKEKRAEMRESMSSADDIDSEISAMSIPPYSIAHQKPVYHMTPQDHTYSKQKSSGGETSDASCGMKETLTETEGSQSCDEVDMLTASEIQSQDSADDNEQSSVIATSTKEQGAAMHDTSSVAGDLGDGSVSMETSSQASDHPAAAQPQKMANDPSGDKNHGSGGKVGTSVSGEKEEMAVGMMELHAETDTGDFVDTKPLLFDKQVSGGFEPRLEPGLELPKSESFKLERESNEDGKPFHTEPSMQEKEKAAGTSQYPPTDSGPSEAAGTEEPALGNGAKGSQDKSSTDPQTQDQCPAEQASLSFGVVHLDDKSKVTSDVMSILSQESGELSQEEDVVSVNTVIISISDEDEVLARMTQQKRPLQQELSSTKRARVEAGEARSKLTVEDKEGSACDTAVEVDTFEFYSEVPESKTQPMDVDPSAAATSGKGDGGEAGDGPSPKSPTLTASGDAPVPASAEHAERISEQVKDSVGGDGMIDVAERSGASEAGGDVTKSSSPVTKPEASPAGNRMPTDSSPQPGGGGPSDSDPTKAAAGAIQGPDKFSEGEVSTHPDKEKPSMSSEEQPAISSDDKKKPASSDDREEHATSEAKTVKSEQPSSLQDEEQVSSAAENGKEKQLCSEEENVLDSSGTKPSGGEQTEKMPASDEKRTETAPDQIQKSTTEQKGQEEKQTEPSPPESNITSANTKVSGNMQPASSSEKSDVPLSEDEFREWKIRLLDKCVAGLQLCLHRFPTHYKSIYRLAHLYYVSETHRNIQFARDLLLGNPDWQKLSHMPANGLFVERRVNNFFQGTWKIPIDEIDRAGSFASHINRSVQLLLDILRDLGDVQMLQLIDKQLRKKPDQGRRYLRDGERQILSKMAHTYMLDAVARQLERPETEVDKVEVLMLAYKTYTAHRSGSDARRAMMLLVSAYQWLGLPQHGFGPPLEQAIQYCGTLLASQAQAMTPKGERSRQHSTSSFTATIPTETTSTGVGTFSTPIFPPVGPADVLRAPTSAHHPPASITTSAQLTTGPLPSHLQMSSTAGVQCNTALPAHFHATQSHMQVPRTPAGDMPAALDLSSPRRPSTTDSTSGRGIVDLVSPVQGHAGFAGRPHALAAGMPYPAVSTPKREYPPAWSTTAQVTPQCSRHSSSPFSSPFNYPLSIQSATPTPRCAMTDDVTDVDLTSDPGDDLALTSPDKLTSDVRHHFHGDLL